MPSKVLSLHDCVCVPVYPQSFHDEWCLVCTTRRRTSDAAEQTVERFGVSHSYSVYQKPLSRLREGSTRRSMAYRQAELGPVKGKTLPDCELTRLGSYRPSGILRCALECLTIACM